MNPGCLSSSFPLVVTRLLRRPPPGTVQLVEWIPRLRPWRRRRPRVILHPSAFSGAEDERAREGLGVRARRGPGTGVGHLQRMAFQMDQLSEGLPAAMVRAQQRPALVLQVNTRNEQAVDWEKTPRTVGGQSFPVCVNFSWPPQRANSGLTLAVKRPVSWLFTCS